MGVLLPVKGGRIEVKNKFPGEYLIPAYRQAG